MSNNEADRLAEPEIQLALFLSQFELDEQERILRYALDHVVPRLKGRAALAKQQAPEATAERAALIEACAKACDEYLSAALAHGGFRAEAVAIGCPAAIRALAA